jgi:hypothetical protein
MEFDEVRSRPGQGVLCVLLQAARVPKTQVVVLKIRRTMLEFCR